MIFDRQLTFINEQKIQDVDSGVIGDAIDLGAGNQLWGRQSFVVIACGDDTTGTGEPEISFSLEFADDAAFSSPVKVPLSFPPIKKADMAKGSALSARSPMYSKRFVRLYMDTTVPITCSDITAGFVLDAQANV